MEIEADLKFKAQCAVSGYIGTYAGPMTELVLGLVQQVAEKYPPKGSTPTPADIRSTVLGVTNICLNIIFEKELGRYSIEEKLITGFIPHAHSWRRRRRG